MNKRIGARYTRQSSLSECIGLKKMNKSEIRFSCLMFFMIFSLYICLFYRMVSFLPKRGFRSLSMTAPRRSGFNYLVNFNLFTIPPFFIIINGKRSIELDVCFSFWYVVWRMYWCIYTYGFLNVMCNIFKSSVVVV